MTVKGRLDCSLRREISLKEVWLMRFTRLGIVCYLLVLVQLLYNCRLPMLAIHGVAPGWNSNVPPTHARIFRAPFFL